MVAGADCISDMDLLRHGAMGRLFTDIRAPSTLGRFLRLFSLIAFVDIDDTVRATYGYAKQGAGRGYTGVKRPQCAAGHDLHTTVCASDRRYPTARRSPTTSPAPLARWLRHSTPAPGPAPSAPS
jgi:hypothetical protein